MLKRLKWNVLHGGGGGEESDGGLSSSDDSEARDFDTANELLARLIDNDPDLNALRRAQDSPQLDVSESVYGLAEEPHSRQDQLRRRKSKESRRGFPLPARGSSSSSDEEDMGRRLETNVSPSEKTSDEEDEDRNLSDDDGPQLEAGGAFWRECDVCPGKRFLHDREVQDHLNSKGHARALKALKGSEKSSISREGHELVSVDGGNFSGQIVQPPALKTKELEPLKGARDSKVSLDSVAEAVRSADDARTDAKVAIDQDAAERKALKRKAAVKMKLKRLKKRKWERERAAAANAEAPVGAAATPIEHSVKRKSDAGLEAVNQRFNSAPGSNGYPSTTSRVGQTVKCAGSQGPQTNKEDVPVADAGPQTNKEDVPVADARRRLSWSSAIDVSGPSLVSCDPTLLHGGKKKGLKKRVKSKASRKASRKS